MANLFKKLGRLVTKLWHSDPIRTIRHAGEDAIVNSTEDVIFNWGRTEAEYRLWPWWLETRGYLSAKLETTTMTAADMLAEVDSKIRQLTGH